MSRMQLQVGCESLSLSLLCVLWLWLWCVCVCGVCCVWVTHAEKPPCVRSKRSVCTSNTSTCVNTWDIWGARGHRQFCLPNFTHVRLSRASVVQQRNLAPIFSLKIGREQHVPDSSDKSLHLIKLFNSRHMTQRHTHAHKRTPQHRSKERRRRDEREKSERLKEKPERFESWSRTTSARILQSFALHQACHAQLLSRLR